MFYITAKVPEVKFAVFVRFEGFAVDTTSDLNRATKYETVAYAQGALAALEAIRKYTGKDVKFQIVKID